MTADSQHKVRGRDGKLYTRDHPHEIVSPHVMRFEEIRWWLKELSTNPQYGWKGGGVAGLERALGMSPMTLKDKLRWRWIWPKEQVRLTARIRDISEGRIVPRRFGNRVEGVITDPPVPPVVTPKPRTLHMRATLGGLKFEPTDQKPAMRLPSFKDAFKDVQFWDPDKRPR